MRGTLKAFSKNKIEYEHESEQVLTPFEISIFANKFRTLMKLKKKADSKENSKKDKENLSKNKQELIKIYLGRNLQLWRENVYCN